ncbi:MAG: NifB/NifX family molybdenum-iron cluster-binding protein [Bacteroidales bacterium]|nr:NifB/NifX family molybdenum-iron cluster-binding protein [Bacteroidales bacterium]
MKIAITAENDSLQALVDARFGRCAYFAVYDTETKQTTFHANPAKEASHGAGPAAVQFVARLGVNRVLAGEFGAKIESLLQDLTIEKQQIQPDSIETVIRNLE